MTYTLIVVTAQYNNKGHEVSRQETDLRLELGFMEAHGAMAKYNTHTDFSPETFMYVRKNILKTCKVGQIDDTFILVQNQDDVAEVAGYLGVVANKFNYFFVKVEGEDYAEAYGSYDLATDDIAYKLI